MSKTARIYEIPRFEHISNELVLQNRQAEIEIIHYLLQTYNLRISEVLSIDNKSFISDKFVYIAGKKGSRDYVIRDVVTIQLLTNCLKMNFPNVFTVNYKTIWHYFKRHYSNDIIYLKDHNSKVTHSFRYKNAQLTLNYTQNPRVIQTVLHHNSLKSQTYYIRKEKTNG